MRHLSVIAVVVILCGTLAGCGGDDRKTKAEIEAEERIRIRVRLLEECISRCETHKASLLKTGDVFRYARLRCREACEKKLGQ